MNGAYEDWQQEQLVPALRDAGVTGYYTRRTILGGSGGNWVTLANVDNMASIGFGLGQVLEQSRLQEVFSGDDGLIVHGEDYLMRYRPDLGFRNEELLTQNQ